MSFFDLWGVRLMVAETGEGQSAGTNSCLYLKSDSVSTSFQELRHKLEFVDEPHMIAKMPDHELWMVFLKDPDGNLIGLMEERALPT